MTLDLDDPVFLVLFGALLSFMAFAFWRYRDSVNKQRAEDRIKIDGLVADVRALQMQTAPFWQAMQNKLIDDLTHPDVKFAEMDELLARLEALAITPEETERLVHLLHHRIDSGDPEVSEDEKESAEIMILVMGKVISEAKQIAEDSNG